ncbi:MAG: hypothetical protein JW993_09285 [Sedimentisphaerales bacterium]|nr:hypothetical protein [Sedimentisphaerales bacterium]
MESQNRIGIYLRKDRATVVCLASQGRDAKLLGCFSVLPDEPAESNQQTLADRIAQECKTRRLKFTEACVALDCALFMQHRVHSDFGDRKKIAATVRFDTEEALATDVSDMAVAFRIASGNEHGSTLDVFTAQRSVLSDILMSLQSNGIDPVAIDPDVYCLSRYLGEYGCSEAATSGTLYALLSDSRGYLVGMSAGSGEASNLRAFLVGAAQDRTGLLAREALVTAALAETTGPLGRMCVSDAQGQLDAAKLGDRVALPVDACDPVEMAGLEPDRIADCPNAVDFAAAYGAALGQVQKDASISFRNDHMPFLGKKLRVQRAVRFLSISLAMLFLAVGIYFQAQLFRVNRERAAWRDKLEQDYLAVMLNKKRLPARMSDAVRDVEGELRRVRAGKTGEWSEETSVANKMTQVLQALNTCAAQADLRIKSITIRNEIIFNGDTSSGSRTEAVFAALEAAGFSLEQLGVSEKDGRHLFTATLKPQKTAQ